jgi:hypothetical protein
MSSAVVLRDETKRRIKWKIHQKKG